MSPDPESGATYFDFELRNSFLHFDGDGDGFIDLVEFIEFLKQDTRHVTLGASNFDLEKLDPIFREKANAMKKNLCSMTRDDYDERQVISWFEFKVFRTKCKPRYDALIKSIKHALGIDEKEKEEQKKKE